MWEGISRSFDISSVIFASRWCLCSCWSVGDRCESFERKCMYISSWHSAFRLADFYSESRYIPAIVSSSTHFLFLTYWDIIRLAIYCIVAVVLVCLLKIRPANIRRTKTGYLMLTLKGTPVDQETQICLLY